MFLFSTFRDEMRLILVYDGGAIDAALAQRLCREVRDNLGALIGSQTPAAAPQPILRRGTIPWNP